MSGDGGEDLHAAYLSYNAKINRYSKHRACLIPAATHSQAAKGSPIVFFFFLLDSDK